MKKLISITLLLATVLSVLSACGGEAPVGEQSSKPVIESKNTSVEQSEQMSESTEESAPVSGTSEEAVNTVYYGYQFEDITDVFTAVDDITVTMGDEEVKLSLLSEEEKKELPLNYTWKVIAPERYINSEKGYVVCNTYNVGDLFCALSDLESSNIEVAAPTEEDLAEYGLDKPYRIYKWTVHGSIICTVYMTKPNTEGQIYLYGTKVYTDKGDETEVLGIGIIKSEDFCNIDGNSFIDFTPMDFVDNKLFTEHIKKLDKISVIKDGATHVFEFEKDLEGELVSATLDGVGTDLTSVRHFYVDIIHPEIIDLYTGEIPKDMDLSISLTHGDNAVTLSFAKLDNGYVYATKGYADYYISNEDFEAIVDSYQTLLDGGIITE